MSNNQEPGLDDIWGAVQSEIGAARRRRRRRRFVPGAAAALLVLGAILVLRRPPDPSPEQDAPAPPSAPPHAALCDCRQWRVSDVAPAVGIATHYPLIAGHKVFAVRGAEDDRSIVCLDKRNGRLLWESALRFSDCRLAADARRLYALARTVEGPWRCAAFEIETGRTLWHRPEGPFPLVPPSTLVLHADGICWTQGNRAMSRSAATGADQWEHEMADDGILSAPASYAGQILVASDRRVLALDAEDGNVLYSHRLTKRVTGAFLAGPILAMHDGRALVASRSTTGKGTLWCIEPAEGKVQWKRRISSPRALLASGDQVFLRSTELTVLDAQTGKRLWRSPVGGCGALSVLEGRLYVADAEDRSRVLVLDGATGRRLEARPIAGSCNGIIVSGRMGFLGSNDGKLYAFPVGNRS